MPDAFEKCQIDLLTLHTPPSPEHFALLLVRLGKEERENVLRQKSPVNRYNSLCARLMARLAACQRLSVPNGRLHFAVAGQGKPYLKSFPQFQFSISHTQTTVGVAVADCPVGLDLERARPISHRIAGRFFSAAEQAYVAGQSDPAHSRRLLEIWTKKEACVKWDGTGLGVKLASVDTLSSPWKERLYTQQQGDLTLSVCCERLPPSLVVQKEQYFFEDALMLEPCEE